MKSLLILFRLSLIIPLAILCLGFWVVVVIGLLAGMTFVETFIKSQ